MPKSWASNRINPNVSTVDKPRDLILVNLQTWNISEDAQADLMAAKGMTLHSCTHDDRGILLQFTRPK